MQDNQIQHDGDDTFFLEKNPNAITGILYHSLFSFKHHYCYINMPMSAGTAISRFLHNYEFDHHLKYKYFDDTISLNGINLNQFRISPSLRPYQISENLFKTILSGISPFLNFSCVRNPYTRIASYLFTQLSPNFIKKNAHHKIINLAKHIISLKDLHTLSASDILYWHNIKYDFIMRFENLEQDMKSLFPKFINNKAYERPKATKNYIEQLYQHPDLIDYIAEYYKEDFKNFGYSTDIRDIKDYDNSFIPRSLHKWHHPEQYPCDFGLLAGKEFTPSAGYHQSVYNPFVKHIGNYLDHCFRHLFSKKS